MLNKYNKEKINMKNMMTLLFVLGFTMNLFALDEISILQYEIREFGDKFRKNYQKTGTINLEEIDSFVEVHYDAIIKYHNNNLEYIWNYPTGLETFFSIDTDIDKENEPNLSNYFAYPLLNRFFNSNTYKNSSKEFKRKSFYKMVTLMRTTPLSRKTFLRIVFKYFNNIEDYDAINGKEIIYYYDNPQKFGIYPAKYILLLAFTDCSEASANLISNASKCNAFNNKKLDEFLSLILVTKLNNNEYLNKLVKIINDTEDIQKATYMFPYLTLIRKKEVVEALKRKLENTEIIDQGDDIMQRYTGVSVLSAYSLYTMIDGFYQFDQYNFNESERQKCLDWVKQNPNYKFRPINYNVNDSIISRVRYMIFENGL